MQTFKTAVVVVILLGVLYGVYVVLNTPESEIPSEIDWPTTASMSPPVVDMGQADAGRTFSSAPPSILTGASTVPEPPPAATPPDGESAKTLSLPPRAYNGLTSSFNSQGNVQTGASNDAVASGDGSYHVGDDLMQSQADGNNDKSSHYLPKPRVTLVEANQSNGNTTSASISDEGTIIVNHAFLNASRSAMSQIEEGHYREALFTLSNFYSSPGLTIKEHEQLLDMLDPLASRVIYSREHIITEPHVVGREEDLFAIAQQYQVPWQLLANINGIENPTVLVPGRELKVVEGPFRAEVDLQRGELTLFLNRLYAGRFPITVGQDPEPRVGRYTVRAKQQDRAYYGANSTILPDDPRNPYGDVWIDLGDDMSIHGSPRDGKNSTQLGCISLSPRDANDVFGILTKNSTVTIRR